MKEAEILAADMQNAVSVGLVMYDPLRNERSNRYLSDGEIALIITLLRAKAQDPEQKRERISTKKGNDDEIRRSTALDGC